jgi:hypothetical protein
MNDTDQADDGAEAILLFLIIFIAVLGLMIFIFGSTIFICILGVLIDIGLLVFQGYLIARLWKLFLEFTKRLFEIQLIRGHFRHSKYLPFVFISTAVSIAGAFIFINKWREIVADLKSGMSVEHFSRSRFAPGRVDVEYWDVSPSGFFGQIVYKVMFASICDFVFIFGMIALLFCMLELIPGRKK